MSHVAVKTKIGNFWTYHKRSGKNWDIFIPGTGWKKLPGEPIQNLPDYRQELPGLCIGKIGSEFGLHIAAGYAENRVAGLVKYDYAKWWIYIYEKLKPLLDLYQEEESTKADIEKFLEVVPYEYTIMAIVGVPCLDVIALDKKISALFPERYSASEALLDGKPASLRMAISTLYSEKVAEAVQLLL